MCGITGFAGAGSPDDLKRMNAALSHRGPDSAGYYAAPVDPLHLAHRRLSILDIEGGRQPMTTQDERLTIVFNGEIYNHHLLRKELEQKGLVFKSDHSDTEVLLMAYRAYGRDMVLKLNGMFAFALYDRETGFLFFARDRFGEKPFYYFHGADCFAFASELTALRQHSLCPQNQNDAALIKFLGYGFVPAPLTQIQDCYKLPAGHMGEYDVRTGALKTRPYWTFRIEPQDLAFTPRNLAAKAEELTALIQQSVHDRMICDVPFGTLLSGGLDSSVITAIAQKDHQQKLKTFSIGFHEKSYDESAYSSLVAKLLGTEHHLTFFDVDQLIKNIPAYLPFLDEPLGDASFLPTALVCEETRKKVTVALTGDGGDELFFGYDPFDAIQPARWLAPLMAQPCLKAAQFCVGLLPHADTNMSLDFKARRFLQGFGGPEFARLPTWMAPLSPPQLSELWGRPLAPEEVYSEALHVWEDSTSTNPVDRMGEYFTRLYLADDILMKADRASMRSALELRSPFLDYAIADFARTLPSSFKYQKGRRKLILKEVAKRLLPPSIINRKKKGFGIPLSAWMRHMDFSGLDKGLTLINPGAADTKRTQHARSQKDWRYALWCDVVLNHYAQRKVVGE